MTNKAWRILKALGKETVKRVPFILGLLVILGVFGAVQSYRKTAEGVEIAKQNTTALKILAEQNKQLSLDNKKLGQDNHDLADQNKAYIKCIADVFAQYTQDQKPVIINDLEKCVTSSLSTPQTSQNTPPQQAKSNQPIQPTPAAAANNSPNPNNAGSGNSGQGESPKLLNCKIDLFTVHIGCP